MALRSDSLPLTDPYPKPQPRPFPFGLDPSPAQGVDTGITFEEGAMRIEHPDGSVTIDFDPKKREDAAETGFYENLAEKLEDGELSAISSDLIDGIDRDDSSRGEWLSTRALGISLLGAKLEKPRSDAGTSSAPLEGMSTVRHPLLMEAAVTFQATARAELLPASGPVKIRNDSTVPPQGLERGTSASKELAESLKSKDDLSQALETDLNHYLTAIATEYVPDTDRMLFYVGFGGDGFKKVYNCPIRRRPVSESIDAEDLIVSNHATDLHSSSRVTHRIKMRKSILRRMQILGAYRDVELSTPFPAPPTVVDKKKEDIAGYTTSQQRPEDRDFTIYETYCELDLDQFAPKKFKGKGLPLPYRVTFEKESRQILDIRRNWKEDDEQCLAKRFFVQFPFIRGLGFYGLGFIHLLGNTTNALTAAWREMLDAGMFASFPGFLYAKGAGRQNTNQFRVAPGTGIGLDIGAQQNIRDSIMPLPYKEVGASFTSFITHVEEVGQRLAATGSISVGEGKQDAPVGTTLALIEQASKVIDSAHKRMHAAQAEEFKLLKERFKEDPEAFWRHNQKPTMQWKKEQFVTALNSCELVPVADPNNPTSLHRIAKAMALKTLQQASPALYDPIAVDMRILRIVNIDPQGLFRPAPLPAPPDPRMEAIKAKSSAEEKRAAISHLEAQIKAAQGQAKFADAAQERQSRERIEGLKIELQKLRIVEEERINEREQEREEAKVRNKLATDNMSAMSKLEADRITRAHEVGQSSLAAEQEMRVERIKSDREIEFERERHDAQMRRDDEEHKQKMEHAKELNAAKVEAARQLARIQKSSKVAKKD